LNPQQMNYQLMAPHNQLGAQQQQRGGLPLQQAGVAGQQGLLAQQQQQQRGGQQPNGSLGAQQQRGQRGPQQQGGAGVPQRNGQQQQNGINNPALNKALPPHLLAQQQQQGGAGNQNIRYADNVRNRVGGAAPQQGNTNGTNAADQVVMPLPSEPLTIKALASAPEEMRKQMIGERLFPLIKLQEPALAGKITGMLLEMDDSELIHLLESHPALNEKISEALQVLQQHPDMVELTQEQQQAEADKQ